MSGMGTMSDKIELEYELTELIIQAVRLEDVETDEIDPESPLFGEGLGLDSIDALEISIAIAEKYGVQLRSDDEEHLKHIFTSVRTLARHIGENIAEKGP